MNVPEQWPEHRALWREKSVLRTVYNDFYRRIGEWLVPGRTLEIGCGSGNFKEFLPSVVAVDIRSAPWLDAVADAHTLPFIERSFANIVLVDVLHHLAEPRRFLDETTRILVPGGRLVLVEPAITAASWFFYHFVHPERVDFSVDPLTEFDDKMIEGPYDGNQAIPTMLFDRLAERFREAMPGLRIVRKRYLSVFVYPMSGGFRRWSLVPNAAVTPLLKLEERLLPLVGKYAAFRMLVVVERAR